VSPQTTTRERKERPALFDDQSQSDDGSLWAALLSKENLSRALKRVEAKKVAPGIDGMTTTELRPWLHVHWPEVAKSLEDGTYRPTPVRRVTIPKPGGGERDLGVPTMLDKFIQQAIVGVLNPIFDPEFSESSFGYRPKRSAHQAVKAARDHIAAGSQWAVEIDLEKFFDRVNHDVLMQRVARKVDDKRVLKLVRRFIESGVMVDGVKQATEEGTPQGSPLSPLLSNIMLDDMDRELERRGHRFVRYADDARIFVSSERAAERVLDGVSDFVERRLKLKVNREKSKVTDASHMTLLGFGFYFWCGGTVRIKVARGSITRLKVRLRELTRRNWGVSMQRRIERTSTFIRGWTSYFHIADDAVMISSVDKWLRRRLRQVYWKQWKRFRTKVTKLMSHGIGRDKAYMWACSQKGPWRVAGSQVLQVALPNSYWQNLGLVGLEQAWKRYQCT